MKERPIIMSTESVKAILDGSKTQTRRVVKPQPKVTLGWKTNGVIKCPYGQVGDRLWVREKFGYTPSTKYPVVYVGDEYSGFQPEWKPSIFMPRWASRITLKVTEVRVERLQDISETDAKAEGVLTEGNGWHNYVSIGCIATSARQSFISLWQKIHLWKYEQKRWEVNPWVWVISFKRIKTS